MTPYETTRYRCDHCRKSYSKKNLCLAHEKECHHDPAVKACTTCRHFVPLTAYQPNVCLVGVFDGYLRDPATGDYTQVTFTRHCSKWEAK